MVSVEIKGLKDAVTALESMSSHGARTVVKRSLMASAKPVVRRAQALAPTLKNPARSKHRTPGLMKALISAIYSRIQNGKNGLLGVYIRPRTKKKSHRKSKGKLDPFYYRFNVAGHVTRPRKVIAGGRESRNYARASLLNQGKVRFIKGTDFLGRAFAATNGEALSIFKQKLADYIAKQNRRK